MFDSLRRAAGVFGIVAAIDLATTAYNAIEIHAPVAFLALFFALAFLEAIAVVQFSVRTQARWGLLFVILFGLWGIPGLFTLTAPPAEWNDLPMTFVVPELLRMNGSTIANAGAFALGCAALLKRRSEPGAAPAV